MTDINWGYNCLTGGIHHGRPEAIWNLPLLQAVRMFSRDALEEIVITRIYQDAMVFVVHGGDDFTQEWADAIKANAEQNYMPILQVKVGELTKYYESDRYQRDVASAVERFKQGKLNPHYEPLHGHDTVNMLCRILGSGSEGKVSYDMRHQ